MEPSKPAAPAATAVPELVSVADAPDPAQTTLSLRFSPVSEVLPLEFSQQHWPSMTFSKGRLLVSDCKKTVWVDPRTGTQGSGAETPSPHRLESVNPATGEVLVANIGSAVPNLSWSKINTDTWTMTPVGLRPGEEVPDILLFTGRGEERVRYSYATKRLERVGGGGEVLESIKPQVTIAEALLATDGVIFCNKTGVFFWPFGMQHAVLLAGHASAAGEADGYGWRARFGALMRPTFTGGRFIFVRDRPSGNAAPASRLVRVDVRTDEVRSVGVEDFNLANDFVSMVPVDEELYVLVRKAQSGPGGADGLRILRASVHGESGPALTRDWRAVDLTEEVRPLAFRLADGSSLHFSGRALAARSEYFRRMLASGCRETQEREVDLRGDPGVGRAAMEDLLRFVATDAFEPADRSPEHAFKVLAIADKYQLPRLRALAEARLCQGLRRDNVLSYLGRVFRSDGALERACWALLEEQGRDILQENQSCLPELIRENPDLAQALITWTPGGGRKRRRSS